MNRRTIFATKFTMGLACTLVLSSTALAQGDTSATAAAVPVLAPQAPASQVKYRNVKVDGVNVFYREAGDPALPTLVLLHGFPSSSHMFRDLIPHLANHFHIVAPDYPGFGFSDAPAATSFDYTFDHLAQVVDDALNAIGLEKYALYMHDYGAPVGFRVYTAHPERITAIITQNGNAYQEGLGAFWAQNFFPYWQTHDPSLVPGLESLLTLGTTTFQYTQGYHDASLVSRDAIESDQRGLDRPGNDQIQLALFYDYRKNPGLYPLWHTTLHAYATPVLVAWGANDPIFDKAGALAFANDAIAPEIKLYDSGHFALEEFAPAIAEDILRFFRRRVSGGR